MPLGSNRMIAAGLLISGLCCGCAGGHAVTASGLSNDPGETLSADRIDGMRARCRQVLDDLAGAAARDQAQICQQPAPTTVWAPASVLWLADGSAAGTELIGQVRQEIGRVFAAQGRSDAPPVRLLALRVGPREPTDVQLLALGAGWQASAVVFERRGALRALPVMPLTAELLVGPPASLPLSGEQGKRLAAVVLAGLADASFFRSDQAGAFVLGQAALELAPRDVAPCSFRGVAHYLANTAAGKGGGEAEALGDVHRTGCLEAKFEDAEERSVQAFLGLLETILAKRGSAWNRDNLPEAWSSSAGAERAVAKLRERAKPLAGRRAEFIGFLIDELDAFLLEPTDECDVATEERKIREQARCQEGLFALGRRDLSGHVPGGKPTVTDRLDPDYFARLRAKVYDPRDRWRLISGLNGLIFYLWAGSGMRSAPAAAQTHCDDLFAEIARQFDQDRWPEATDRNLSRLTSAMTAAAACPDRKSLNQLYGRVLAEAGQGEAGKLGVVVALMSMVPDMFMALMGGQQHKLMVSLEQMHDAVQRQIEGLGQSAEDRALGAILRVFLALRPALTGQLDVSLTLLTEAETQLAALPFPPPDEAPMLVRIAPGCHLVSGYILAIGQHMLGQSERVGPVLARVRAGIERTVPYTMVSLEAGDQAEAALNLALALQQILEIGLVQATEGKAIDGGRVVAAIARAWPEPGQGAGAWRLGLGAGQVILADLTALVLESDLSVSERQTLLAGATAGLGKLVRAAVVEWDLGGMDWDFLRLLPAAHAALEHYLLAQEGADDRLLRAVLDSVPKLDGILAELEAQRPAEARMAHLVEHGSLPSVLMEMIWTARRIGLKTLLAGESQSLQALNSRMREVDEVLQRKGRQSLRTLVGMCFSMFLRATDQDADALIWIERAEQAAAGTDLGRYQHVLSTMRAQLLFDSDPLAARKLLRTIIQRGDRALACGKTHAVHALHLPMAWMAMRTGEGALAQAQIDRYLELLDKGFPGEAIIDCKYTFDSDRLVFNTTLKAALSNLIQSTTNEQSFQIGAGAHTSSLHQESFSCAAAPLNYRRHDRVLLAQLMGASYALLAGDDVLADRRLRSARATWRLIQNGSKVTLEPHEADGLEAAREHAYRPLMFWTGVLAQLRGHVEIGEEFESAGRLVGSDDSRREALGLGEEPGPAYLGDLASAAQLRDLMGLWLDQAPTRKGFSKEMKARLALAAQGGELVLAQAPLLLEARYLVGQGDFAGARKILSLKPPQKLHPQVALLAKLVAALDGKKIPPQQELADLLVRTAEAGYVPSALRAADALSAPVEGERGLEAALSLFALPHKAVEKQMDVFTHGLTQLDVARLLFSKSQGPAGFEALIGGLVALNARIPLQVQLGRQLEAIKMGLQLDRLADTRQLVASWLPGFERALSADAALVYQLRAMTVALTAGLDGRADEADLDLLIAQGANRETELAAATAFLKKLKKAQADKAKPEEIQALCRDFLVRVLQS